MSRSEDESLLEVSRRVPSFGGWFVDHGRGVMSILLTDGDTNLSAARDAILAIYGIRGLADHRVQAVPAAYSYQQLHGWWMALSVAAAQWITGLGVSGDRITLSVTDPVRFGPQIGEMLAEHDIPTDAVMIEQMDPVQQLSSSSGTSGV
jgi:hypothetical protein